MNNAEKFEQNLLKSSVSNNLDAAKREWSLYRIDWVDVHGVYPDEVDDLTGETYQELYLKEVNPIVCESEDEFINMCKQFKRK